MGCDERKDAIYLKENFDEADGMRAGHLKTRILVKWAGIPLKAKLPTLLNELGVKERLHSKAPERSWRVISGFRVLLAQGLFGKLQFLLLEEAYHNLDRKTVMVL